MRNMKKFLLILVLFPNLAFAEMNFDYNVKATSLYGYSTTKSHNNLPQNIEAHFAIENQFNDDYSFSFNVDLNAASNKEIKNYNNGDWGQEIYGIFDSPYGRLMLGETYNVAQQFHSNGQDVGPLGIDNSDIVNFIANPNWQRDNHITNFSTLNSTAINTDGVAPKASYISPEFYSTNIGFSYTPKSFDKRGLIAKDAAYSDDSAYIASIINQQNFNSIDLATSLSYGYFENNNQEFSLGIKASRGGFNIGAGYARSYADNYKQVELFDSYRESEAFDIGVGYEIGPYKVSLTYLQSKALKFDNKDKILLLSQTYQINKWLDVYLVGAYAKFEGSQETTEGYATVTGVGLKF